VAAPLGAGGQKRSESLSLTKRHSHVCCLEGFRKCDRTTSLTGRDGSQVLRDLLECDEDCRRSLASAEAAFWEEG
jgi:hypothetical protein